MRVYSYMGREVAETKRRDVGSGWIKRAEKRGRNSKDQKMSFKCGLGERERWR